MVSCSQILVLEEGRLVERVARAGGGVCRAVDDPGYEGVGLNPKGGNLEFLKYRFLVASLM